MKRNEIMENIDFVISIFNTILLAVIGITSSILIIMVA